MGHLSHDPLDIVCFIYILVLNVKGGRPVIRFLISFNFAPRSSYRVPTKSVNATAR